MPAAGAMRGGRKKASELAMSPVQGGLPGCLRKSSWTTGQGAARWAGASRLAAAGSAGTVRCVLPHRPASTRQSLAGGRRHAMQPRGGQRAISSAPPQRRHDAIKRLASAPRGRAPMRRCCAPTRASACPAAQWCAMWVPIPELALPQAPTATPPNPTHAEWLLPSAACACGLCGHERAPQARLPSARARREQPTRREDRRGAASMWSWMGLWALCGGSII